MSQTISATQTLFPINNDGSDIKVKKLSHIVADRLRMQIITGQRKSGEFLPPEADLLTQFRVSRPILREALRILEVESLIALGRGARSGATVLSPSVERSAAYASMVLVNSGTTMFELHQARTLTEPAIVAYLARDARHKHFAAQLQAQIDIANDALAAADYQTALFCVSEFHTDLIKQSGNKPLTLQAEVTNLLMRRTGDVLLEVSGQETDALRQNMAKTTASYQKLVDFIDQGKVQEAEEFWRRYMIRAQGFLERTGLGARNLAYQSVE